MSAPSRVLIAGHNADACVFACLLRHAGYDVALLGAAWQPAQGLRLRGLWGAYDAEGFQHANTIDELTGAYSLMLLVETHQVAQLRSYAPAEGLALALSDDLRTLDTIAAGFGAEQTLGARLGFSATLTAPAHVSIDGSHGPTLIGPLEVSDCVMMEQIHSWIRAFQAARIPCAATPDMLAYVDGKSTVGHVK
ncbi:MAG: hypothetical protein FJ145_07105 [Deltaproteobacteria bacterium]|nr:hypothetical protein [Deltaproteobacteria bacterium]